MSGPPLSRSLALGLVGAGVVVAVAYSAPGLLSVPWLRRRLSPELTGIGRTDGVALTFDDGPDPLSTPNFLRVLERRRVRATFFLLGRMVRMAPQLAGSIRDAGHEVGLHGYDHRCLLWRGPRATYDDLARGRDAIAAVTGSVPRWFRPPYGVLTTAAMIAARRL